MAVTEPSPEPVDLVTSEGVGECVHQYNRDQTETGQVGGMSTATLQGFCV